MQAENLVIGFARSFSVSPFGGICKRCEAPLQASPRRGDMQAVRSTLAGFAEKRGDLQSCEGLLQASPRRGRWRAKYVGEVAIQKMGVTPSHPTPSGTLPTGEP